MQAVPSVASLSTEDAAKLTERIQNAGTEVVTAKVRPLTSARERIRVYVLM